MRPALAIERGSSICSGVRWSRAGSSAAPVPDHPAQPARVSELMLPARGLVARLLVPRDASAVLARAGTSRAPDLRPDSGAGERRRSVIRANLRWPESYLRRQALPPCRIVATTAGRGMRGYDSGPD